MSPSLTTPTMDFLISCKGRIDARLQEFLSQKEKELSQINHWGNDVMQRLLPFVVAGKTIRGSLVVYTYLLFHRAVPGRVLDAAAALELFHSGFLVHDDIMDKDVLRRGQKAIHAEYGENIGICIGDFLFFLGYELLSTVNSKLIATISRELSTVTVGQMQDVSEVAGDIQTMYRYKTARYTFSLPFIIGSTLANADTSIVSKLEKLGESLGLLFQFRDDELDAESRLPKKELIRLQKIHHQQSIKLISELPIDAIHKKELASLLDFCQNRKK